MPGYLLMNLRELYNILCFAASLTSLHGIGDKFGKKNGFSSLAFAAITPVWLDEEQRSDAPRSPTRRSHSSWSWVCG